MFYTKELNEKSFKESLILHHDEMQYFEDEVQKERVDYKKKKIMKRYSQLVLFCSFLIKVEFRHWKGKQMHLLL